ncbi:cytochrome bd-I oxidase subunit CydX [Vreelandella olivaria]|nr:cytochrome bd-I oxidase subunit CydX [Halomonas olivaria]
MWYFAWILGVTLAATISILNAMWLEVNGYESKADHERRD